MAIVKMKKLRLVGLSSEKEKIIGGLLRSGAAQLKPTQEIDLTVRGTDAERLDDAASVYSRAVVALDFLAAQERELKKRVAAGEIAKDALPEEKKGGLFSARESVSADEFESVALEREELLGVCAALSAIAARKTEIKAEESAQKALTEGLKPYEGLRERFSSFAPTRHVSFVLGTCKAAKTLQENVRKISETVGAETTLTPVGEGKVSFYLLFSAVETPKKAALDAELSALGFTPCPYSYDCTAKEKIAECEDRIKALQEEDRSLTLRAAEYLPKKREMRLFCDHYRFRMELIRAEGDFAKTAQTFILEAFVPEPSEKDVKKRLEETTDNVILTFEDVADEDYPPTLLKNNALVAPYESITSVYSPPSYKEADPNPAVAVFYFIFFGIMLGDAGYGLLLAVACFLATRLFKMEKGAKNLLCVFAMGGVSAIVWGILFGGVFSIEAVKPVWFAPMDDPVTMLILCFALGLVQIFVGMGYQAHDLIKNGRVADAVYDIFSWYAIFLGAGLTVLSMLFVPAFPAVVGLIVLIAGAAVLMFGGAIRSKGVLGRIIGAVKPLYGIVNYFSDVMSYSRLFGLCLASGVIGLVFNTLGGLVLGLPGVGWLFAVLIYLLGHTLNFAIGLLGIYVHDSRLQYIEFFGRFYHGGGRAFAPLGLNLKYVTIKQEV